MFGIQELKLFEIPLLNHPKCIVFIKCIDSMQTTLK